MPDTKITALAAITTVDPAADVLPIVDVSDTSMAASGTTKKITSNQILGAGGTATLASATITGAATAARLVVTGNTIPANGVYLPGTNSVGIATNSTLAATIDSSGNLGLGVTPSAWSGYRAIGINNQGFNLYSNILASIGGIISNGYYNGSNWLYLNSASSGRYEFSGNTHQWFTAPSGTAGNAITFTQAMTLDASGRFLVGTATANTNHIASFAGAIGLVGTASGTPTSYISSADPCSIYYTNGGGSGYFTDFGNLIIQPRTSAARNVVIATSSAAGTPVERIVAKPNGQVRFVPLAADPAGAEAGDVYYNSVSNKLRCYNGTTWNDLF